MTMVYAKERDHLNHSADLMSALRKHTLAIRFTLMAYLVFASVAATMGGLCCSVDAHVKPDCNHADCSAASKHSTSNQEPGHHQHSGGEKSSAHDHCIHCSCQFCAVIGTDYIYAVNASASSEFKGVTAEACFTHVAPSVEILITSLSPPGPFPQMPIFAGLQSVVLLI